MPCCPPTIRLRKKKITELPPATLAALDDLFETVQYNPINGEFTNRKQTLQVLVDLLSTIFITAGGGSGNLGGVVPPEGVVTAAQYTLYTDTLLKNIWIKESAGVGNTGWQQY